MGIDSAAYRERVLPRHRDPDNAGPLPHPDVSHVGTNPLCGERLALFVSLSADGTRIDRVTFQGEACAVATAATDLLCEAVAGTRVGDVAELGVGDVGSLLGLDLSQTREQCARLGLATLQESLAVHRGERGDHETRVY